MDVALAPGRGEIASAPGTNAGHRQAALFVWLVWAGMFAAAVGFVLHYGSVVPFADEWAIVPTLSGNRPLTLDWLWAQHNEHRIPLARLILLGLYRATDFDVRSGMLLTAGVLGTLAAAMIRAARVVRGRTSCADAFFPLALLNWGHDLNLLMGWQVVFAVPVALAGTLLVTIVRGGETPGFGTLLTAGACVVLLPLAGGMGLALVPAAVLWLTTCGVTIGRSRRPNAGRDAAGALAGAAGAAALLAVYFVGFERPARTQAQADAASVLRAALGFLATCTGRVFPEAWFVGSALAVTALAAAAVALGVAWAQRPGQRLRVLGLGAFLAGLVCLALAVAWGRAGLGPAVSQARRYVSLSVLVLCGAYFVFVLYAPGRAGRVGQMLLGMATAAMLWPNAVEGIAYGRQLHAFLEPFVQDLRAGVPRSIIAERYTHPPDKLYSDEQHLGEYLDMLHGAGLGLFRELRPDPAWRTVTLRDEDLTRPAPAAFVLKRPRFVYAFRFQYAYEPKAPTATMRVAWRTPAGAERERRLTVAQQPWPESLITWVNEPVARISIRPDDKPCACTIWGLELVVPKSQNPFGLEVVWQ